MHFLTHSKHQNQERKFKVFLGPTFLGKEVHMILRFFLFDSDFLTDIFLYLIFLEFSHFLFVLLK